MEGLEEMHENWEEGGDMEEDEDAGADPPRIWWPNEMMPGIQTRICIGY